MKGSVHDLCLWVFPKLDDAKVGQPLILVKKLMVIILNSKKTSNLIDCFGHSHIALILLSSVLITFLEILCPKYVSDFLKTYWVTILVLLP